MDLKLKELRRLAGYRSMRSLAEKLGVPTSTYASWECGTRAIPLDKAVEVAELLGCSLDEMTGRKPIDKIRYYFIELPGDEQEKVIEYAEYLAFKKSGREDHED